MVRPPRGCACAGPERRTGAHGVGCRRGAGDGWRYELVAGRLVHMPPPGASPWPHRCPGNRRGTARVCAGQHHWAVSIPTTSATTLRCRAKPTDTVLGADVSFVSRDRSPSESNVEPYKRAGPTWRWKSRHHPSSGPRWAPRPGSGSREAHVWYGLYGRSVDEVDVWTPDTDMPLTLSIVDHLDGADVLPGFSYALADLFA